MLKNVEELTDEEKAVYDEHARAIFHSFGEDGIQFFDGWTQKQLLHGVYFYLSYYRGEDKALKERLHDAPSIDELWRLSERMDMEDRIRYSGYIIRPPREDCRVTVTGFSVWNLSFTEMLELLIRYKDADNQVSSRAEDGYFVEFGWE